MNNNKVWVWVLVVVVVLGILYFAFAGEDTDPITNDADEVSAKGTVVVSFTDAAANMNNISEISMRVDEVSLYSQSGAWISVSDENKEFKLLDLNKRNETQIYSRAEVDAGVYTRARVALIDTMVQTRDRGNQSAALPSRVMDMEVMVSVRENETTSLKMDVLADQSLHTTTEGEYVFAPVIAVESRSGTAVATSATGAVILSGGIVDVNKSVGMDIDGSVKNDFRLDPAIRLDVNSSTIINLDSIIN